MKKYLLIATIALGLAITACSGGQKTTEAAQPATEAPAAQPAVTATADSSAMSADAAIAKYADFVDKAIALQ
jgi:hypothetical protein